MKRFKRLSILERGYIDALRWGRILIHSVYSPSFDNSSVHALDLESGLNIVGIYLRRFSLKQKRERYTAVKSRN